MFNRSMVAFEEAKKLIPGGVNSPVRAFKSVGGQPVFIAKAEGPYLWDIDGNRYIDYIGSWGPMILGHGHPEVLAALQKQLPLGLSFGAPTEQETAFAAKVRELMPSIELLRLVSSGTEACMSAIRVARGYTGKDLIVKFDGNYHGHADCLLAKAGSGVADLSIPDSPGVPKTAAETTIVCPYNDPDRLREVCVANKDRVAAIIVEPIVGNSGFIRPSEDFLVCLRELTENKDTLLIFDEVMTGFRVARGGAQELFGITPDLTTLGKILGGGLPIGGYGGREDIMAKVAPRGSVYQAGTLSGNPLAVAGGLKTLSLLQDASYELLAERTRRLVAGMVGAANDHDVGLVGDSEGGMFGFFFAHQPVTNFAESAASDHRMFTRFYDACLRRGVYFAPSPFEAGFISFAHDDAVVAATLDVVKETMELCREPAR